MNRLLESEIEEFMAFGEESSEQNVRNGFSNRKVKTDDHVLELSTSQDRQGEFEPQLVEASLACLSMSTQNCTL